MTLAENNASSRKSQERRRRIFRLIAFPLIVALLIVLEMKEAQVYKSENCELKTSAPSESMFMKPMYGAVLRLTGLKGSPQVVSLGIDEEMQFLQTNVCPARSFTADLLKTIAAQGPALIAIDKYYTQAVCSKDDSDPDTAALLSAIANVQMPVVLGSSTTESNAKTNTSSCLAAVPQLFTSRDGGPAIPPNVHMGLTRLNENPLKIPLTWDIFSSNSAGANLTTADSFALVAAKLMKPELNNDPKFQQLLRSPQQPYTNTSDLPLNMKVSDLVCAAAPNDVQTRWNLSCRKDAPKPDLSGKIVVVGAESPADKYSVLGQDVYGYQLQAGYIAALLNGAYLRDIFPWLLIPFLLVYLLAQILLPYMEIHQHPVWPLPHVKHAVVWETGLFCVTMLLGFFVPLLFHRFPPLAMLLVIAAVFVPDVLFELWFVMNEEMEQEQAGKELQS